VTLPMVRTLRAAEPDAAAAGVDAAEARDVRDGGVAGERSEPEASSGGERHGAGIRDIGD
jgi:hypothetical protein